MSNNLSAADRTYLSAQQQAQIQALKQAWADASAAGDQAGMARANQQAEAIRATAGYAGGSDGSGYYKLDQSGGGASGSVVPGAGKSAAEVQNWVTDYKNTHYNPNAGWVNGYSTAMNLRSMANYIRQQMEANSNAWASADAAGKAYLHDQNQQLAQILEKNNGGAKSVYNEKLGRWETDNANLGYGYNTGQYNDLDWYRGFYGMTDQQIDAYRNDTDRYHNFVDQQVVRNWVDESSGFTGQYAQFVNGPYGQLLGGTNGVDMSVFTDLQGDGFADEADNYSIPERDANGNIIPRAPALKNNNSIGDYTKQFTAYVEDGVIQPGKLKLPHLSSGLSGGGSGGVIYEAPQASYGSGGSANSGLLDQWQVTAEEQAIRNRDYAVDKAVQQLLAAQAKANGAYQTQRDQIARDERNALDNAALYAEARGDRGGIGQTQYNRILAQAAANRQTVNAAQSQLANETQQQIIQLRAEGKFQAADDLLEISQTYLLKLLELEQWAAEFGLDNAKFQASVAQWQQEYWLKAAKLLL